MVLLNPGVLSQVEQRPEIYSDGDDAAAAAAAASTAAPAYCCAVLKSLNFAYHNHLINQYPLS